ncbi:MAG: hypothetical protein PHR81_05070 [Bacteroidales bacterium]|jgi:hypothetical protein|nr:hypothetical protein [Bacteroidales bacterium]MDD4214162.1 hypothetical protein [Bacteroidales bacterium]
MKSLEKIRHAKGILFFVIWSIQCGLFAQNQSMLLPFSGDTYPTATGSKMINFMNPSNPIITTLPKHDFDFGNSDPHLEYDLHAPAIDNPDNLYLFNEKYLGQHPMYAQRVVHDGKIS